MSDHLFKLFSYLRKKSPELQAHYYRYQHLLDERAEVVLRNPWLNSRDSIELARLLSKCAPIDCADLDSARLCALFKKWKRTLPMERNFFRMMFDQNKLVETYSGQSLRQFLQSSDGIAWFRARSRLRRRPHFELDRPFKRQKKSARSHEIRVRALLRRFPLLTWKDLRQLRIKNAQAIYEGFLFRERHRKLYLDAIEKAYLSGDGPHE